MKFDIKNRWTGETKFTAEIECAEDAPLSLKLRLAVNWKIENSIGVRADLTDANLTDANLTRANLTDANLTDANLTGANLTDAHLTRADLTRAHLTRADLTDADLTRANLTDAKNDVWAVLSSAPTEVAGLLLALQEGRVDGSTYHGDCACLVGTIANVAHCNYDALPRLRPDSNRSAERFFLAIKQGDTPANSQPCRIAAEWVEEWLTAMQGAFGPKEVANAQ